MIKKQRRPIQIRNIRRYHDCEGAVGTQRAYLEFKYFKIVKLRDAKYSLKMAAEKWRQKSIFKRSLFLICD